MRFGTLPQHLGCGREQAIERAADIGLDGIELLVPDGIHEVSSHRMRLIESEEDPTSELFSTSYREELRRRADEHGVALPSICPSFLNFRPGLTAEAEAERREVCKILEDLISIATDIRAQVLLVPFFREASIDGDDERDRVARGIQSAAATAAEADVTLALETDLPATKNRLLLEDIDSPATSIYYDVANTTMLGYDPATEIRKLGDDIAQVHFKDGNENYADAMLGEGQVDFEGVARALDSIGYDDWIVLETTYDENPVDAMTTNLEFARSLVA